MKVERVFRLFTIFNGALVFGLFRLYLALEKRSSI